MDSPQKDLVSQIADVERAYGGKTSWQREIEAQNTKLAYEHWLVARTPAFKAEFGDWEARRGTERLNELSALDLSELSPLKGKEEIKEIFKGFGSICNSYDGRKVVFPTSIAGKIDSHKGFEMRNIVKSFDLLFSKSIPMLSELEESRENHKDHTSNILGFSHYAGKFRKDDRELYIRFTVESLKDRRAGNESSQLHSSFVSSISIYGHSAKPPSSAWGQVNLVIPESSAGVTRYDRKLAAWLIDGKQKLSPKGKILEAREPTNDELTEFLGQQQLKIPFAQVTLPLSSESQKLTNSANALRKLRKNSNISISGSKELKEFEQQLNALTGPDLTAIPLKRIAMAVAEGKCSDKKLRKACLAHENAIARSLELQRGKPLGRDHTRGIDL